MIFFESCDQGFSHWGTPLYMWRRVSLAETCIVIPVLSCCYSDVIWASRRLKTKVTQLLMLLQAYDKRTLHYRAICEGNPPTVGRWIPHTNGPVMRKAFHVMPSGTLVMVHSMTNLSLVPARSFHTKQICHVPNTLNIYHVDADICIWRNKSTIWAPKQRTDDFWETNTSV